jgi:hypothetical protein
MGYEHIKLVEKMVRGPLRHFHNRAPTLVLYPFERPKPYASVLAVMRPAPSNLVDKPSGQWWKEGFASRRTYIRGETLVIVPNPEDGASTSSRQGRIGVTPSFGAPP